MFMILAYIQPHKNLTFKLVFNKVKYFFTHTQM